MENVGAKRVAVRSIAWLGCSVISTPCICQGFFEHRPELSTAIPKAFIERNNLLTNDLLGEIVAMLQKEFWDIVDRICQGVDLANLLGRDLLGTRCNQADVQKRVLEKREIRAEVWLRREFLWLLQHSNVIRPNEKWAELFGN